MPVLELTISKCPFQAKCSEILKCHAGVFLSSSSILKPIRSYLLNHFVYITSTWMRFFAPILCQHKHCNDKWSLWILESHITTQIDFQKVLINYVFVSSTKVFQRDYSLYSSGTKVLFFYFSVKTKNACCSMHSERFWKLGNNASYNVTAWKICATAWKLSLCLKEGWQNVSVIHHQLRPEGSFLKTSVQWAE